ncbi:hypothetical protein KAFR_0D01150 [Kazachstania africana CBS 2517]|uniref:Uncharacterized protein n=1 Tax=Kazachstania africana (strain ATCC 22294 / BCRC 22015 / CBS 2517 / CECT 1963 / NBRC 1671 / NRRL Y-8276) TaxID=1071382 RepID=H2ATR1_KAZAF|nr:hypothetical protein KAFR_0D01150 [Kazachstania africana CBS 2517]CCF57761.1 hypothetical protein KAFR_0D01150 [Kazachstania africana CBS 2517]
MNLLIDRMEHPGTRRSSPFWTDSKRPTIGGKSKRMQDTCSRSDVPIISVNGRPVSGHPPRVRETSLVNLSSMFQEDIGMMNESEDNESSNNANERQLLKKLDEYSSAFGGKFSDFEFATSDNDCTSEQNTAGSSTSGLSPHKTIKSSHRRSSVLGHDKKRLVHQFLNSTDEQISKRNNSCHMALYEDDSTGNIPEFSHKTSFTSLLFSDLNNTSSFANLRSRTNSNSPMSNFEFSSSASSLSLLGEHNEHKPNLRNIEQVPIPIGPSTPGVNKASFTGFDIHYQTHLPVILEKFENILQNDLTELVLKDESDLAMKLGNFDKVSFQLKELQSEIIKLKSTVQDEYLVELKSNFNSQDEISFEFKFQCQVMNYVTDLEKLEKRMEICQAKLGKQREILRQMDNLLLVEEELKKLKQNTKAIYKYRFILVDLVIFGLLFYVLALINTFLTA